MVEKAAPKRRKPGPTPGYPSGLLRPSLSGAETVHDTLVKFLRLGLDVTVCAAKAGVSQTAMYDWLRDGSRLAAQIEAGSAVESDLGVKDAAVLRFAREAMEAVADAEAQALGNVVRLARGATRRKVSRTMVGDKEVQRTVTEEELPPDLAANVVILERRFAERWGRRQQIAVSVASDDQAPAVSPRQVIEARLAEMAEKDAEVAAIMAELAPAASPTT